MFVRRSPGSSEKAQMMGRAKSSVRRDEALAFLIDALRARRGRSGLVVCRIPAVRVPLVNIWNALPDEPAMLWDPPIDAVSPDPSMESCVALGEVAPELSRASSLGREPVERIAFPGQTCSPLRWLGAWSFEDRLAGPPCSDLPSAPRSLPRWRYTAGTSGCSLHLTVHSPTDAIIAQVEAEYRALTEADSTDDDEPQAPVSAEHLSPDRWQEWVGTILEAIDRGEVTKVVAARCRTISFAQPLSVPAILRRLRSQAPGGIVFGLRRGRATFLGATPELLVRKHGRGIATDALAGTLPRDPASLADQAAQLLGSEKDRREHDLVVNAIKQRLDPLCSGVVGSATPMVRVLPRLLHLHTPIMATARDSSIRVLDILRAPHPTPAVGGTSTADALRLIEAHEPRQRGLFAGPIGWWDEEGNGELAVAIRSGLIVDNRAHVYAGAGIVRGSDPSLEYAETAAKMETLISALVPARPKLVRAVESVPARAAV
jgi:isochorismate synthase